MLQHLSIKNYAIISELEIEFSGNLNIITGETGAGKSILLGALSLVLGKRADSQVLYRKEQKCIVEATFDIRNLELSAFFQQEELDYEAATIIRRELTPAGKSRAFINDTPVKLSVLRSLSSQLVSLHSQHEVLELMTSDFQIRALDQLCRHEDLLKGYGSTYQQFSEKTSELLVLKETFDKNRKDLDYYQFQLNELMEVGLEAGEQEMLEEELGTLSHAEEIKSKLSGTIHSLQDREGSILDQLNQLASDVESLTGYNSELKGISERLNSSIIELSELSREIEGFESAASIDPGRLQEVTERLNELYRLEKKHGVERAEDLVAIRDGLDEKVRSIDASSDEIVALEQEIALLQQQLNDLALQLRENRLKTIPTFEKSIGNVLKEVGIPNAQFKIELVALEDGNYTKNGLDKVGFLFSANKGTDLQPVNKVASGGELSRLMLAIKSQMAKNVAMPTLIFDEIDAGISGEVAVKVGGILKNLSHHHQLISITHLPQIASKADRHFFVYKETKNKVTSTNIRTLSENEQLVEIAKMLSGDQVSEAALANAKELLLN